MRNAIGARLAGFKIILLVVGIAMIAMSMGDAVKIWKSDFAKLYDKSITGFNEDELVTGKIEYVIDPIATLESSQTVYGIPVSKKMTPYYLCLIPYNEKTGEDGYYIIVHATKDDTIKVMDYALEYMNDGESSDAEIKSYIADMMLEEKDFGAAKWEPLLGLVITLIPIVWFIISKKRTQAYKNSRTHYVNQGPSDPYNTAPVPREGASGQPMRRYSPEAYNAHTYAGGISPEQGGVQQNGQQSAGRRYDPSAYGGGGDYQPGEMDSIDTSNLKL